MIVLQVGIWHVSGRIRDSIVARNDNKEVKGIINDTVLIKLKNARAMSL